MWVPCLSSLCAALYCSLYSGPSIPGLSQSYEGLCESHLPMSTALDALFAQLRHHHPTAALTTALLSHEDSTYVVKASITLETGGTLTAMAAADRVEDAEDRACERALGRIFGLVSPAVVPAPPTHPEPQVTPDPPPRSDPPAAPPPAVEAVAQVNAEPPMVTVPPTAAGPEAQDDPAEGGQILPPPSSSMDALPPVAGPPVDLSDIIAQTDVELRRLGWGVNEGRTYLEQTYGKRSRHDLTDEELLAFLLHLESQPNPSPALPSERERP